MLQKAFKDTTGKSSVHDDATIRKPSAGADSTTTAADPNVRKSSTDDHTTTTPDSATLTKTTIAKPEENRATVPVPGIPFVLQEGLIYYIKATATRTAPVH